MSRLLLALALAASAAAGHAGVPDGVNGTWFNPAQSGHGLNIEVIDAERAIALWYAYDPDGNPLTLYLDGQIDGDSIVMSAFAPSGMRFGEFDPATVETESWGQVTITFADCASAVLEYDGGLPGYGSGSLPLIKLGTAPPVQCSLDAPRQVPPGKYRGGHFGDAFIDDDGHYYGAQLQYPFWSQSIGVQAPSVKVMLGEPVRSATGRSTVEVRALANAWLCHLAPATGSEVCELAEPASPVVFEFTISGEQTAVGTEWTIPATVAGPVAITSQRPSQISQRTMAFLIDGDAPESPTGLLEFGESGELCVRVADSGCVYQGQLTDPANPEALYSHFELHRTDVSAEPYRGKAWLEVVHVGHVGHSTLSMFGSNGQSGLALQATGSW